MGIEGARTRDYTFAFRYDKVPEQKVSRRGGPEIGDELTRGRELEIVFINSVLSLCFVRTPNINTLLHIHICTSKATSVSNTGKSIGKREGNVHVSHLCHVSVIDPRLYGISSSSITPNATKADNCHVKNQSSVCGTYTNFDRSLRLFQSPFTG